MLLQESKTSSTQEMHVVTPSAPLLPSPHSSLVSVITHHWDCCLLTAHCTGHVSIPLLLDLSAALNVGGHLLLSETLPSLHCWDARRPIPVPSHTTVSSFQHLRPFHLGSFLGPVLGALPSSPCIISRWFHPVLSWNVLNAITTWEFPKATPLPSAFSPQFVAWYFHLGSS